MIASKPALALSEIHESATNPRRSFDKAALEELTESVRKHGVLQPILVRPNDQGYELVAGHRRFRAATAAGLDEIPAVVRELDDREVLEIQVVENLQREDLHPLEEAEGYRRLHEDFEYSVDELAAKVGKSKSYVYARMKLCAIAGKARELFLEGKLDASRALLIARIPVPELADQAAVELVEDDWIQSYREAADHIQENYMLRLSEAPFPANDADLVPDAGPCKACPKRTGNQRELFGDVKSADVCTDPVCFRKKVDTHWERQRAIAEEKGQKILEGNAATEARYSSRFVRLDSSCHSDPKRRTWRTLLGRAFENEPESNAVLARFGDGSTEILIPNAAAVERLRERGHDFAQKEKRSSESPQTRAERAHKKRTASIAMAIGDVVTAAEAFEDATAFLRFVAKTLLGGHAEPVKSTAKRRGWETAKRKGSSTTPDYSAKLDELGEPELRGVVVELIAMDMASSTWGAGYGGGWKASCDLLGVDMKPYERKVAAAARKKKTAKKTSKKKATTKRKAKTTASS